MHRNGLKGHQHIAQGIALGRRTIVKFALKGHKPYHASLCFCPCRAPLLRFALTQDDALGYVLMAFQAVSIHGFHYFRNFSKTI